MKLYSLDSFDFLNNKIDIPLYALGKYSGTLVINNKYTLLLFYDFNNQGVRIYPTAFINKNYILRPFHCYLIASKNNYLEIVKCIGEGTILYPQTTLSDTQFYAISYRLG